MYSLDSKENNEGTRQESRDSEHLLNDSNKISENETTSVDSQLIPGQQSLGSSNLQGSIQVTQQGFQFIEVNQFGKPRNATLKKFVHANARRRSTLKRNPPKQRTIPREILSKHAQGRSRTILDATGSVVLGSASMRSNILEDIPLRQSPSVLGVPRGGGFGNSNPNQEFVSFGGLLSRPKPNVTVAASQPISMNVTAASQPIRMNVTPEFDRWQSRDANTPYCLYMVEGAPILYMQARTWPFPYPLRGPVPRKSLFMVESPIPVPDSRARRSCLNRTSQPATFITQSMEYFIYKGETIRWISDQLSNHQIGASDNIIGVILCLTMWEIGRSYSRESAQHMKGIERIVNLRGGLENLEETFQLKILMIDIYVAIVTNGIPIFRGSRLAAPRRPPLPVLGLGEISTPDSPLYQCGNRRLDNILINSRFCSASIRILQHMSDLTNAFTSDRASLDLLLAADSFIMNPTVAQPSTLFIIIQNAAIIYRGAFLLPPIPLSSPLNYPFVTTIVHLLSNPDNDETWLRFPGILLWVLLTGTVAACNHPDRPFFIHFYGNIMSVARWSWRDEIIETFEKFFPLRRIGEEMND